MNIKLYESTNIPFWDDEHISKYMLEAHLNPDVDSASRSHEQIIKSVKWIRNLSDDKTELLDLGCGPGIYAELFDDAGFNVTGIDFSKRSVEYAKDSAQTNGKNISYLYQDYLSIDYKEKFDVVTLIYCDFGVIPTDDRRVLLGKIFASLNPGGIFIVDAFTPKQYENFKEDKIVSEEREGFWSSRPYRCTQKDIRCEDYHFLEQYNIETEDGDKKTYNIWNHAFTKDELGNDLCTAGFSDVKFYNDVTGVPYSEKNNTICAVARKGNNYD